MDESWRMRMGMSSKPNIPRRKSTEDNNSRRPVFEDSDGLDADDFRDVFGGPPRTILSRQFSGDFTRSTMFYEEIFRPAEDFSSSRTGRNLPEFRIPGSRQFEAFYDDIFGSDGDLRRSRSRSRSQSQANSKSNKSVSNSSSVLSSEDLSPLRPANSDEFCFSSFASKLRPINVPGRWNSSTMMHKESPFQQGMPAFSCNSPSYNEHQYSESDYHDNYRSFHTSFTKHVSSPETISLDLNSYGGSVKVAMDDLELNSPSSVTSTLCQDSETKFSRVHDQMLQEQEMEDEDEEDDDDDEDDEAMSSYVIEINSNHRNTSSEELGIDDAIAWAKERFQSQSPQKEPTEVQEGFNAQGSSDGNSCGHGHVQSAETESQKWAREEETKQMEVHREMEPLDESIMMWSSGKETNIRLLLSTLHYVLWPNSGWYEMSLTNLIESSHVKKAYQKARLCLHPDKLQQRGATIQQKYIAEKAFSILQDAWAAFISHDGFQS